MAPSRAITAVGGLIVAWSLLMAFVLVQITEMPPGLSVFNALAADPTALILVVSDLSAFVVGLGTLLCGVIAELSPSRSRQLLGNVATFAIIYGCAVSAGVIALVWRDTRSLSRTLLWSFAAVVMGILWIALVRTGQRYVDKRIFGSAENRQL